MEGRATERDLPSIISTARPGQTQKPDIFHCLFNSICMKLGSKVEQTGTEPTLSYRVSGLQAVIQLTALLTIANDFSNKGVLLQSHSLRGTIACPQSPAAPLLLQPPVSLDQCRPYVPVSGLCKHDLQASPKQHAGTQVPPRLPGTLLPCCLPLFEALSATWHGFLLITTRFRCLY